MASESFPTPSPSAKDFNGSGEDERREATSPSTRGTEPPLILPVVPVDDSLVDTPRRSHGKRKERAKERALARDRAGLPEIARTPEKTLYSYATEEELSQIQIPLQIKHTSTHPFLTESEADTPCSSFGGLEGLLDKLNKIFGTEQALSTHAADEEGGLRDAFQLCIDQRWDLGTAYGYLRARWHDRDRKIKARMDRLKKESMQTREAAIDNTTGRITHPRLPLGGWMSSDLRHTVSTTINGDEWPVPIPKDTTLARIRVELLNLGAQYAWLDVLCLRQKGPAEKEGIRLEEWKLDVPTIGNVYQQNQPVVHYFSGLGRPFVVGDLDSDRHWLNRAWTLQEISTNVFEAGIHPGSRYITDPELSEEGRYLDQQVSRFKATFGKLYTLAHDLDNVFDVLRAMRKRAATEELDKIAGMGYLLRCKSLPQYDTKKTSNQAFSRMLDAINSRYRGDLFFRFPPPRYRPRHWSTMGTLMGPDPFSSRLGTTGNKRYLVP
ncbi:hypothetical protein BKA70DRAFT_1418720 [Coprinopsis sp. MPI-PUGE-AT-0042]|nr:hypothetical protein BKA70DRAFT_1418720 [Coprinopsis sp. MPI-PUGE-AT-0042]